MLALKLRSLARARRGQTMVLGVLGVLMVAITMIMTLNVGQALHEKIRVQQLADAAAFSNANQVARAFNFFAYTNRANVGALVAASSMHAYMGMSTAVPELFFAGQMNFLIMAGIEFAVCMTCCWPYCFSMCQHCIHAFKNLRSAMKHGKQGRKLRDKVKDDVDPAFIRAITAVDYHMKYIALSQTLTYGKVVLQLMQDSLIKKIKEAGRDGAQFAPKATNNLGMTKMVNAMKFIGAVHTPMVDEPIRRYLAAEIANASRWSKMVSSRNLVEPFIFFVHPTQLLSQLLQECPQPSNGMSLPVMYKGESRVIASPGSPKQQISRNQHGPSEAEGAGAVEDGLVFSTAIQMCIFSAGMVFPLSTIEIGSGKDGAQHKPRKYCTGVDDHKNMKCLKENVPSCFMTYKGEEDFDQSQPHMYSLVGQDLRLLNNTDEKGPWKITDKGTISVDLGGSVGNLAVHLSDTPGERIGGQTVNGFTGAETTIDRDGGLAMSKAIAYYHFPPDWKEEPNLFAPHWKAKLQPMRTMEAMQTLLLANKNAYQAMALIAPLP